MYVVSIEEAPKKSPKYCKLLRDLAPIEGAEVNNRSRIFMCSSIEEGFGLPVLEAITCKKTIAMVENICKLFENDDLYNSIVQAGIKTASARGINVAGKKLERTLFDY